MSISGNTAIGGAWSDAGGVKSGSAHMFTRHGEQWIEQPNVTASDNAVDGQFGFAVSIDGKTVIIGSASNGDGDDRLGAAHNSSSPIMEKPQPAP